MSTHVEICCDCKKELQDKCGPLCGNCSWERIRSLEARVQHLESNVRSVRAELSWRL